MTRAKFAALSSIPVLFAATTASAAPERIRGTIEKIDAGTMVVDEGGGKTVALAVGNGTKVAYVVPSSLDAIRKDDFIGTATKGPKSFMVALELVIFPNSMRGAGEGQYAWDPLPDSTMRQAAGSTTSSTMTNGSVSAASPAGAGRTRTQMTNGTVSAGHGGAEGRTITVDYGGGQSTILVPPTATIVRLEPADRAALTPGAKVFVRADDGTTPPTAGFVGVGKGVTPPM